MTRWRSSYAFALHRDDESRWSEAKLILGSFLIILLVGTLFLVQPSSHKGEVTFVNALFTATSAISVSSAWRICCGMPNTRPNAAIPRSARLFGGCCYAPSPSGDGERR